MLLDKLFLMQKDLDKNINDLHATTYESTKNERILAFLVELSEFANETRCFKYWSNKGPSPKDVILEEYIDGIHFLLSIGLMLNIDINTEFKGFIDSNTLTINLIELYSKASNLKYDLTIEKYIDVFNYYLGIGEKLGFSKDDIINSYINKNKINYERQKNNY